MYGISQESFFIGVTKATKKPIAPIPKYISCLAASVSFASSSKRCDVAIIGTKRISIKKSKCDRILLFKFNDISIRYKMSIKQKSNKIWYLKMDKQIIKSEKIDRLDKFLADKLSVSRNQIMHLIKNNNITVNMISVVKCGYKINIGDTIEIRFVKPKEEPIKDIDFDVDIEYEDDKLLVINKPPFLITHPAPSVKSPTLVDWLKYKKIKLSTISGELRYGIVHRLDKETSGAMVVAKTNDTHTHLSKQLESKTMGRFYIAIIDLPLKENIFVKQPIYRNKKNRLKMSVCTNGKYAKSAFVKLATSTNGKYELIGAKLFTGRTHQIRAHLAYINRHILGDKLYGYKKDDINRVFLHSYILYLKHPTDEREKKFVVNIPEDIASFLKINFDTKEVDEKISSIYFDKIFETI